MKNSIYNSVSWVINIILGIITVPLFLNKLETELYGIYILIIGLIGYYNLIDLGLGQAIIKYVAEYKAKEDYKAIFYSVSASIIFNLFVGVVTSIFLFIFAKEIVNLLNISFEYTNESILSVQIISFGFLFSLLSANFASVFQGFQNYKITSILNVSANILVYTISLSWLYMGKGIVYVISTHAGVNIIVTVIYFVLFTKMYPAWLKNFTIRWIYIKKLFSFSIFYFLSRVFNIVSTYLVQFIISVILSPIAVTYYIVPRKFTNSASALLGSSVAVMVPKVSELEGKKDQTNLIDKYWLTTKVMALLSFPIFIIFIFFAKEILVLWVGNDLANKTHFILIILSIQTLIGVLTIIPNNFLLGLGKTKVQGFFALVTIFLTISIVPLFTYYWDVQGTVIGLLLCTTPGIILVLYLNKKILHLSNKKYIFEIFNYNYIGLILLVSYFIYKSIWTISYTNLLILKFGLMTIYLLALFWAIKRNQLFYKTLVNQLYSYNK